MLLIAFVATGRNLRTTAGRREAASRRVRLRPVATKKSKATIVRGSPLLSYGIHIFRHLLMLLRLQVIPLGVVTYVVIWYSIDSSW